MAGFKRDGTSGKARNCPVFYRDDVFAESDQLERVLLRHNVSTDSWPAVTLKNVKLYTGATLPKLDELQPAQVHVDFGCGIYLTDDKNAAAKYALDRFNELCFLGKERGKAPTLYTAKMEEARLLVFDYDWEKEISLLKNEEFIDVLGERAMMAERHCTSAMDSVARTTKAMLHYIRNFSGAARAAAETTPIGSNFPRLLSSYYAHKGFVGRIDMVSEPVLGFTVRQFLVFDPRSVEIIGEFDLSGIFSRLLRMEELDSRLLERRGFLDESLSAILRGR